MSKTYEFEVGNKEFKPDGFTGVKTGDSIVFKRVGNMVTRVRVKNVRIGNSPYSPEGTELLFGDVWIDLTGQSEAVRSIKVALPENVEHTYLLEIEAGAANSLWANEHQKGKTDPMEKGTITVVGGQGPNPWPDGSKK